MEYPDIARVCKEIGAEPTGTRDGEPLYTVPVIHDPTTGTTLSDSGRIAEYLDATYPDTHVLFPKGTRLLQYAFKDAYPSGISIVRKFTIPATYFILNTVSAEFFKRTRETPGWKKIEEWTPTGKEREDDWKKVEAGFSIVDGWFQKHGEGKYLMGESICFADIVLAGELMYIKTVLGEKSREWQDISSWNDGRWEAFLDGFYNPQAS